MGADLIGFIIKGPRIIDTKVLKDAEVYMAEFSKQVRACRQRYEEITDPERIDQVDYVLSQLKVEFPSVVDKIYQYDYDQEEYLVEKYLDIVQCAELEEYILVRNFYYLWTDASFRDCMRRVDPHDNTQQIMFAGEMSWGDEPEGMAYKHVQQAMYSGLLERLGIS